MTNEDANDEGEDDRADQEDKTPLVFVKVYNSHLPSTDWLRKIIQLQPRWGTNAGKMIFLNWRKYQLNITPSNLLENKIKFKI